MRKITSLALIFLSISFASAQDELFNQLDSVKSDKKEIETAAFKALQICNLQSTKLPVKGELYILISHRFGDLSNGMNNFFGLDNALTKIGGIYGVANWLSIGVSRHTFNKTYEVAAKYKLANQKINGFPITIVGYNTVDINSDLDEAIYPQLKFNNRLAFSSQLLLSRKFSESFSAELAPILVHKNLYDEATEKKDVCLIGMGGRYKLSKRLSLNIDYAAQLGSKAESSPYHNPLTVGLDIDTGGHIFQMVFSNGQPMTDVTFLTNSIGSWEGKKSLYFGFNMYRVF